MSSSRLSFTTTNSYTETSSSSTFQGPGALTGKAVKAVGEALLRGAENIIIRRRLATISLSFPHDNSAGIKNIEQMYDDLLELSRYDIYGVKTRERALKIILEQVSRGQTDHLIHSLFKWSSVETQLLASEILQILQPGGFRREPTLLTCTLWMSFHPMSLLIFVSQMAISKAIDWPYLIEMGLLDAVLGLCLDHKYWDAAVCDRSLHSCVSSTPETKEIISRHPIFCLWPSSEPLSLRDPIPAPIPGREEAWRKVADGLIRRRIATIPRTFHIAHENPAKLFDVWVDLLEFTHSERYSSDIADEAKRILQDCLNTTLRLLIDDGYRGSRVLASSNLALSACASLYTEMNQIVSGHAVFRLWPSSEPFSFRDPPVAPILAPDLCRHLGWKLTGKESMKRRMTLISRNLTVISNDPAKLLDVWVDLLEFSNAPGDLADIAEQARRLFRECLDNILVQSIDIKYRSCNVLAACDSALSACVSCPKIEEEISRLLVQHPLFDLWPSSEPFPLRVSRTMPIQTPNMRRKTAWRAVGDELVRLRIDRISLNFYLADDRASKLLDEYIDLLEFSDAEKYPPVIVKEAKRHLSRYATGWVIPYPTQQHREAYRLCCEAVGIEPVFLVSE